MYNIELKKFVVAGAFSFGATLAIAEGDHAIKHNKQNPHPSEKQEKTIYRYNPESVYNIGKRIVNNPDTFCKFATMC